MITHFFVFIRVLNEPAAGGHRSKLKVMLALGFQAILYELSCVNYGQILSRILR